MELRARLGRPLAAFVLLALLTLLTLAAQDVRSAGLPTAKDQDCPKAKRDAVLRKEQQAVLARLGDLTTLRGPADLKRLAAPPLNFPFPTHQFTSFEGIGLTIFNPVDPVRQGAPNFLFYAPSPKAKDATDPHGADFPYKLIGFGYGVAYTPGQIPSLIPCVGTGDWHIHERGIHPLDSGGMVVMPPAENGLGDAPGQLSDPPALRPIVGFPHPRSWTTHFWIEPNGVPRSAIVDPTNPPAGVDAGVGSSFYFLDDKPQGATEPTAYFGRPVLLTTGEGTKSTSGGNVFTLKAGAGQTQGRFSFLDATLSRDGQLGGPLATAWYVLGGKLSFEAKGQRLPAPKGSFVYIPGGDGYTFTVDSAEPARALLLSAPGGIEQALGFKPPPGAGGGGGPPGGSTPPAEGAKTNPFVLRAGEGETVFVRQAKYVYKAKTEDTGGALTVMDATIPRGGTPGPHTHHKEFEGFFLLDGDVTFQTGGQTLPAQGGDFVLLPRALPHSYAVDSDKAKILLIAAPSGLEQFFRSIGSKTPSLQESLKFGVEPQIPPSVLREKQAEQSK